MRRISVSRFASAVNKAAMPHMVREKGIADSR
jgi:hypothetical protein